MGMRRFLYLGIDELEILLCLQQAKRDFNEI